MNSSDVVPSVGGQAPKEFVYNTSTPPPIAKKQQTLLPLYNDKNPMLLLNQPEFIFSDPPCDVIEFANQLLYTMNHYGGIGLAAPQCGFPYRLFVMAGGIVCINPVIVESSKTTSFIKEGCLSFPGLYLSVTRPEKIRIKYTDEYGKRIDATWTGATARTAQHELDHLNGVVFTRLVGSLTLQMAKKKRQKLFKKIERVVELKGRKLQMTGKVDPHATTKTIINAPTSTAVQSHREN